ncbi:hypothetical protein [Asticcacaulis solisilvae]|uniref:hypothetical protein n=1 Tax=Asticcacaulis solisilvae TaxID=1217274 RepID=UPI003FD7EEC1
MAPSDLRQLRYSDHFLVWSIRTSLTCCTQCRTLVREMDRAFGPLSEAGQCGLTIFLKAMGQGKRVIRIGRPGHIELTQDEKSFLALFEALQAGDRDRAAAHARWLAGSDAVQDICLAAGALCRLFTQRGLEFRRLEDTHAAAEALPCGDGKVTILPKRVHPDTEVRSLSSVF